MNPDEFASAIRGFTYKEGWKIAEIDDAITGTKTIMEALDTELTRIRAQLDHAKAERFETGKYAEPRWLANASAALRHKGRQRQTCQSLLAELGKKRRDLNRAAYEDDYDRTFVAICKERMSKEEFLGIWAEVRRRRLAKRETVGNHG